MLKCNYKSYIKKVDTINLEFNIAVHFLTFLAKHADERFSSKALSELICVNPVQLRRVTSQLVENQYVETIRGKYGGYQANESTATANLGDLFQIFTAHNAQGRLYTGTKESECEISRKIEGTMKAHHAKEHALLKQYYENFTIQDILEETVTTI